MIAGNAAQQSGSRVQPNFAIGDFLNMFLPFGTSGREQFTANMQAPFANAQVGNVTPGQPPRDAAGPAHSLGPPRFAIANQQNQQVPGQGAPIQYRYDANGGRVDLSGRPVNAFGNIVAGNPFETHVPTNRNTQMYRPRPGLFGTAR